MKRYNIYEMKVDYEYIDDTHVIFTESPFVCLGYLEGAQAVYEYLKYKTVVTVPHFHDKDVVNRKVYTTGEATRDWGFLSYYISSRCYYYIEDEFGRLRDFKELTYNAKKSCQTHKHHRQANKWHGANNHQEQRRAISPQEVKEITNEYKIHLCSIKTKRVFDAWDSDGYFKISKSWKDQTKRKHQYKYPKKGL